MIKVSVELKNWPCEAESHKHLKGQFQSHNKKKKKRKEKKEQFIQQTIL